jgi:hypothetical protein
MKVIEAGRRTSAVYAEFPVVGSHSFKIGRLDMFAPAASFNNVLNATQPVFVV